MHEPPEVYPAYQPRRFPWGCLLGGCAGALLLMLGGVALTGFMTFRFYKNQITKYTAESPTELPSVEVNPEEMAEIEQRVKDFREQLEKGEAAEPLVLTEQDLNALINQEEDLRGRVYVSIDNGQISAEVSVPTDMLPGAKGRYFNGNLVLDASLENGVLIVKADEASVNGEPVPEEFMRQIRDENLAKDAYKDPESAEWLRKFESIEIVDDTVVLTPVKQPAANATVSPSTEAEATATGQTIIDSSKPDGQPDPGETDAVETDAVETDAVETERVETEASELKDSEAEAKQAESS